MDNRPLELRAENEVSKQLTKLGLFVCKPMFDSSGSDLLIVENLENTPKLVIIQSKGRSIKKNQNSNVKINSQYLDPNFIVFIYVEKEDENRMDYLYCFFQEHVCQWTLKNGNYILNVPTKFNEDEYFLENDFSINQEKSDRIVQICQKSEIDFANFIKDMSLGLQSEINWKEEGIFPSLESLNRIYINYDVRKTTLGQDILFYVSGIKKESELEDRLAEFPNDLSFEFLTNTFLASSSNITSIFEDIEIYNIKQVECGVTTRYLGYTKYIILEMDYSYKNIVSEGAYCFVKDDDVDAIEMFIHKNDLIKSETNFIEGNAKEIQHKILSTIGKND